MRGFTQTCTLCKLKLNNKKYSTHEGREHWYLIRSKHKREYIEPKKYLKLCFIIKSVLCRHKRKSRLYFKMVINHILLLRFYFVSRMRKIFDLLCVCFVLYPILTIQMTYLHTYMYPSLLISSYEKKCFFCSLKVKYIC